MERLKDKYRIIKRIKADGFGEVYKCRNLATGQKVAIKLITNRTVNEGVPSYIMRQVSLLKELQHDNVLRLLNVLTSGRYVYLVFEYLDLNLHSFITRQKKNLNSLTIKAILKQILLGFAYCHTFTLVHRDLKPKNILIDLKSNTVKLADFGLFREFGPHERSINDNELSPYRAPEILIGCDVYSTPIDMWALGCVFAEMVTGKPLFPCAKKNHLVLIFSLLGTPSEQTWPGLTSINNLLHLYPHNKPENLAERFPDVDLAGVDLLSRMLSLNPRRRITAENALKHEYLSDVENVPLVLPPCCRVTRQCIGSNTILSDTIENILRTDL